MLLHTPVSQRAQIVLLAAEGVETNEIVHRVGVSKGAAAVAARDVQVSTDPELEAKVRDVVGLYLNPLDKGGGALDPQQGRAAVFGVQ